LIRGKGKASGEGVGAIAVVCGLGGHLHRAERHRRPTRHWTVGKQEERRGGIGIGGVMGDRNQANGTTVGKIGGENCKKT